MQLRAARHTERLDELVRFYQDGLGLTEIGGFHNHNGYDGVFLKVPGSGAHFELTAGGEHGAPLPHPESLLVLYLGGQDAVEKVVACLGINPVVPAAPYLAEHGITVADPDGFRIVLAPERWQSQEIWIAWAVPRWSCDRTERYTTARSPTIPSAARPCTRGQIT
jgi:catechol 2,3-dioxygenase-like lactoylglutathione lyase family enzyme